MAQSKSNEQGTSIMRQDRWPVRSLLMSPGEFFRMSPFSMMRRMQEEMERAFGESWRGGRDEFAWSPAVEVSQREGNYVIRAELPGLKPEEVKVECTEDAIVFEGERRTEQDETRRGVHMSEIRYGRFHRTIPLPEGAKSDGARARFDNGVLEITIPVDERKTQRRQIPVQAGAQAKGQEKQGEKSDRAA